MLETQIPLTLSGRIVTKTLAWLVGSTVVVVNPQFDASGQTWRWQDGHVTVLKVTLLCTKGVMIKEDGMRPRSVACRG